MLRPASWPGKDIYGLGPPVLGPLFSPLEPDVQTVVWGSKETEDGKACGQTGPRFLLNHVAGRLLGTSGGGVCHLAAFRFSVSVS